MKKFRHYGVVQCILLAVLAVSVSSCGGGGGNHNSSTASLNPTPTPTPTPTPPPTTVDNLLAGAVDVRVQTAASGATPASETDQYTLYLFDPDAPATPNATIPLDTFTTMPSWPVIQYSDWSTVDPNTHTTTYSGHTLVFYVKSGKIYKIDLRRSQSHTPTQLSTVANACQLNYTYATGGPLPVSADGTDSWLAVTLKDGDGSCSGANVAYVRSTMSATDPAVSLPTGTIIYDVLDDGTGNTAAFLARDSVGLALYGADLSRVATVSGTPALGDLVRVGDDFTSPHAGYYTVDGTLRRLTWTSTSANLEDASYTFKNADAAAGNVTGVSDSAIYYFADGSQLYAVSGGGKPNLFANLGTTPVNYMFETNQWLELMQIDKSTIPATYYLSIVSKIDGTTTPVLKTTQFASLLGASENFVFYSVFQTGSKNISDVHAFALDGSGDNVIYSGPPGLFGLTLERSYQEDMAHINSFIVCAPTTTGDDGCSNGTLSEINASSLVSATLGYVSHVAMYPFASINIPGDDMGLNTEAMWAVSGIPRIASFYAVSSNSMATQSTSDLYMYKPGMANSFVQLTHTLP